METPTVTPPVTFVKLKEIATEACDSALADVTFYDHPKTDSWNTNIINTILKNLISETSTPTSPPSYKFAVNSTIIQDHPKPSSTSTSGNLNGAASPATDASTPSTGGARPGRRGMHSATGAYWNNERDGMWSFKYEAGEGKGLDVVVSIIWIAV